MSNSIFSRLEARLAGVLLAGYVAAALGAQLLTPLDQGASSAHLRSPIATTLTAADLALGVVDAVALPIPPTPSVTAG